MEIAVEVAVESGVKAEVAVVVALGEGAAGIETMAPAGDSAESGAVTMTVLVAAPMFPAWFSAL